MLQATSKDPRVGFSTTPRKSFFIQLFQPYLGIYCSWSVTAAGLCSVPPGSVSIAIVTFNSSRYIRRCLEAALAQEGGPLEVVVVDNASTDDTLAILRRFESRVRVIH